MAVKNKVISNPRTGQEIRFLQTANETSGQLLEMEASFKPHSKEPPPHYHPHQEEDFTVLEGEITVRMDGYLKILRKGDRLHVPKNQVHSMWNNSGATTILNWQIRPAMQTDHFLETAVGLAMDGKTNEQGVPNILQVALMANRFSNVFRMTRPSFAVQKILFTILTPIAYLTGYRPTYKKYLD